MDNTTHLRFTDKIKYLGSTITTNLRDEIDVASRITIAHSQISQMRELFNCRDVLVATEKNDVPSNPTQHDTMGCDTWALKEKDKRKLDACHHTAIRRILGISTRRVREERITNKMVRSKFMGISPILSFITRRTLKYILKTARDPCENTLQKKFMSVYCYTPKHVGDHQCTYRDSFRGAIKTVLRVCHLEIVLISYSLLHPTR
jgi:hypothetical protein